MKPRTFPLTIHQGSTFRIGFKIKSVGVPADLTGCSARLQIREAPDETSLPILDLSVGSGLSIDAANSRVLIEVSGRSEADPSTADLGFDRAVYDLFLISDTGEPQKIAGGPVHYVKAVTHVD